MKKVEKPPKYKCIKVPIIKILNEKSLSNNEVLDTINNAVLRTNKITTKAYFLLRLWVLNKYHTNQEIPVITADTISMCIKSLLLPSRGPKATKNNLLLFNEFNEFKEVSSLSLEDGSHLSAILDYYSVTMLTSIENNIKMHFFDYIKRFINTYFKHVNQDNIHNKEFKKQLYKEINFVKNDIINNTLTCNEKYHDWLNVNRHNIVPITYEKSYYYDIVKTPYKYLKYMIFMCLELEKIGKKSFQFFPIQSNAILRHIQIDTKALVDLLVDTKKNKDLIEKCVVSPKNPKNKLKSDLNSCLDENKEFIWDEFLDISQGYKNHVFDYAIITNGFTTSLRFLHKNSIDSVKSKKEKMRKARTNLKGLSVEEKINYKTEKQKLKNASDLEIKNANYKLKNNTKKEDDSEFQYIDEVPKEKLEGNCIFIDPGKRSLLTMMNDKGEFLSYTNKKRINETKRLKYQKTIQLYKNKLGISKIEE